MSMNFGFDALNGESGKVERSITFGFGCGDSSIQGIVSQLPIAKFNTLCHIRQYVKISRHVHSVCQQRNTFTVDIDLLRLIPLLDYSKYLQPLPSEHIFIAV